jgi:hypothetical protein
VLQTEIYGCAYLMNNALPRSRQWRTESCCIVYKSKVQRPEESRSQIARLQVANEGRVVGSILHATDG